MEQFHHEEDEWDFDLLDKIIQQAEQENKAKRSKVTKSLSYLVQSEVIQGAVTKNITEATPTATAGNTALQPVHKPFATESLIHNLSTHILSQTTLNQKPPNGNSYGSVEPFQLEQNPDASFNHDQAYKLSHSNQPLKETPRGQGNGYRNQNGSNNWTDEISRLNSKAESLQRDLAEKEGAVSLLRSRLSQAENELFELRRSKSRPPNGHAPPQQTPELLREIERLRCSLAFKEEEVIEVQHKEQETEEQLQLAKQNIARLEQQLQALVNPKSTPGKDDWVRPLEAGRDSVPTQKSSGLLVEDSQATKRQKRDHGHHISQDLHEMDTDDLTERAMDADVQKSDPVNIAAAVANPGGNGGQRPQEVTPQLKVNVSESMGDRWQQLIRPGAQLAWGPGFEQKEGLDLVGRLLTMCRNEMYCLMAHPLLEGGSNSSAMDDAAPAMGVTVLNLVTEIWHGSESPVELLKFLLRLLSSAACSSVQAESAAYILQKLLQYSPSCRRYFLTSESPSKAAEEGWDYGYGWKIGSQAALTDNKSAPAVSVPQFLSNRVICSGQNKPPLELRSEMIAKFREMQISQLADTQIRLGAIHDSAGKSSTNEPVADSVRRSERGNKEEAAMDVQEEDSCSDQQLNRESNGEKRVKRDRNQPDSCLPGARLLELYRLLDSQVDKVKEAIMASLDLLVQHTRFIDQRGIFLSLMTGGYLTRILEGSREVSLSAAALQLIKSLILCPHLVDPAISMDSNAPFLSNFLLSVCSCLLHSGMDPADYIVRQSSVDIILRFVASHRKWLQTLTVGLPDEEASGPSEGEEVNGQNGAADSQNRMRRSTDSRRVDLISAVVGLLQFESNAEEVQPGADDRRKLFASVVLLLHRIFHDEVYSMAARKRLEDSKDGFKLCLSLLAMVHSYSSHEDGHGGNKEVVLYAKDLQVMIGDWFHEVKEVRDVDCSLNKSCSK